MGLRVMDPTYGRAMSVGQQFEQRMVSANITAQTDRGHGALRRHAAPVVTIL